VGIGKRERVREEADFFFAGAKLSLPARLAQGIKNLRIIYCDGKNVFDSMNAMTEAKRYALEAQLPVIVHASCVRIHSHSNSDRQDLYRDENELHCALAADPLNRYRITLIKSGKFTDEELNQIDTEAQAEVSRAHKKVIIAADPDPTSIFNFVTPEPYVSTKYPEGLHTVESGEKWKLIKALNETLKAEF